MCMYGCKHVCALQMKYGNDNSVAVMRLCIYVSAYMNLPNTYGKYVQALISVPYHMVDQNWPKKTW